MSTFKTHLFSIVAVVLTIFMSLYGIHLFLPSMSLLPYRLANFYDGMTLAFVALLLVGIFVSLYRLSYRLFSQVEVSILRYLLNIVLSVFLTANILPYIVSMYHNMRFSSEVSKSTSALISSFNAKNTYIMKLCGLTTKNYNADNMITGYRIHGKNDNSAHYVLLCPLTSTLNGLRYRTVVANKEAINSSKIDISQEKSAYMLTGMNNFD